MSFSQTHSTSLPCPFLLPTLLLALLYFVLFSGAVVSAEEIQATSSDCAPDACPFKVNASRSNSPFQGWEQNRESAKQWYTEINRISTKVLKGSLECGIYSLPGVVKNRVLRHVQDSGLATERLRVTLFSFTTLFLYNNKNVMGLPWLISITEK